MPTYDFRCKRCLWSGERSVSMDDSTRQICAAVVQGQACRARLELLISTTAQTRGGFGFTPSLGTRDGKEVYKPSKRRPATVRRG